MKDFKINIICYLKYISNIGTLLILALLIFTYLTVYYFDFEYEKTVKYIHKVENDSGIKDYYIIEDIDSKKELRSIIYTNEDFISENLDTKEITYLYVADDKIVGFVFIYILLVGGIIIYFATKDMSLKDIKTNYLYKHIYVVEDSGGTYIWTLFNRILHKQNKFENNEYLLKRMIYEYIENENLLLEYHGTKSEIRIKKIDNILNDE